MKVKLGGKEYTIQFATRPSLKSHILQDIMKTQDMEDISSMEDILLELAEKHLQYSSMTLTEIAREMNFPSIYVFSRFYKRKTGVSPLKKRRKTP